MAMQYWSIIAEGLGPDPISGRQLRDRLKNLHIVNIIICYIFYKNNQIDKMIEQGQLLNRNGKKRRMMKTGDLKNKLSSNRHCPFSAVGPVLHILCILIIVGFGFPATARDGVNRQSNHDLFKGMDMELPSDTIVKRDKNNATIIFLKGKNLSEKLEKDKNFQPLQKKERYAEVALAFISANNLLFKIVDPVNELTVKSINIDDLGFKHIKFQQEFNGTPVWASELNVHLDRINHVYLIQGRYIPPPVGIDTQPVLKEEDAKRIVVDNLASPGYECLDCRTEMIIFTSIDFEARLAYRIVVTLSATEGWIFIIDAVTGAVLEKLPTVYNNTPL